MAVPLPTLAEHPPGGDVQGGKQRRRAVPDVVVGVAFDVAQAHGQRRLGAIERLNLRRVVRRVEVQPDDVAHFLDEERIGGQLEGLRPMRLDPEQSEPALYRALADALGSPQGACAPVRDAEAEGDRRVGQAFGAGENHACPLDQGVGQGGRPGNSVELILLLVGRGSWRGPTGTQMPPTRGTERTSEAGNTLRHRHVGNAGGRRAAD